MRKVFIDCGSWEGISINFFKENHPKSKDFEIFGFECNPFSISHLNNIEGAMILEKAVWVKNVMSDFYLSTKRNSTEGSTLCKEKKTGAIDTMSPLKVECIDFSKWIVDNFNNDDFIMVKMNIEGAEYEVLNKMIKDGSFEYIDKLYIQWHWKKVNYPKNKHVELLNRMKDFNVEIYPWPLDHDREKNILGTWKEDFLRTI